ncbi:hypothetical protein EU537_08210 [Candidatus Thorarchaeota archaeon]|nr:MAG: hypothetical protein EU537_08210 [Candidatus Thorarchaeota archaeon]
MIDTIEKVIPYISGLWTLPWIVVGFLMTLALSKWLGKDRVDAGMKKVGFLLLFVFIPLLLFRIFLNIGFGSEELRFASLTFVVLTFMYLISYLFGYLEVRKIGLTGVERRTFIKTVLTNQGRSAAFVGGIMLSIQEWRVPAAIYISIVGIGLFAIIPYMLSMMHNRENQGREKVTTLPGFLRLYPWYLLSFVIAAVIIHRSTGITVVDLGDAGTILHFITALTIPAGLYYVGAGIDPKDLKLTEMKKLFSLTGGSPSEREFHWSVARNAFFTTLIATPLAIVLVFGSLMYMNLIPKEWFAVIALNSVMPITSTNMFLIPYGIDRKGTALAITWTTIIAVPALMLLIPAFVSLFT